MNRSFLLLTAISSLCACAPAKVVPTAEIPKLTSLKDVMDAQAGAADPQFKKAGGSAFIEADFAGFVDTGDKIQATSTKLKEFSKGPGFDALAARLFAEAQALSAAGHAKDAAQASVTLKEMKAVCKECHSKFR